MPQPLLQLGRLLMQLHPTMGLSDAGADPFHRLMGLADQPVGRLHISNKRSGPPAGERNAGSVGLSSLGWNLDAQDGAAAGCARNLEPAPEVGDSASHRS
jgi:hypothetical protein